MIKAISFASFKLKLRRRRNFTAHSCVAAAWGHTSKLPYMCILVDSSQLGNLMIPALTASKLASESFKNQGLLIRYIGSFKVAARTLIFFEKFTCGSCFFVFRCLHTGKSFQTWIVDKQGFPCVFMPQLEIGTLGQTPLFWVLLLKAKFLRGNFSVIHLAIHKQHDLSGQFIRNLNLN